MTRRILALITATVLALGILTPPATAATSPCTRIWFTAPTFLAKFEAGQSRCVGIGDKVNGWVKIYSRDDRSRSVIDYAALYTRTRPHSGRVESTADAVQWLARKHNVSIQFANRDLAGRMGCAGGFINSVSGAYQGDRAHPGEGLVRIGAGTTTRCMKDRRTVRNVAKHEIAHVLIERKCGRTDPPMATPRVERVTTAYAFRYLGASSNAGGIGHSFWDTKRAVRIHNGNCG